MSGFRWIFFFMAIPMLGCTTLSFKRGLPHFEDKVLTMQAVCVKSFSLGSDVILEAKKVPESYAIQTLNEEGYLLLFACSKDQLEKHQSVDIRVDQFWNSLTLRTVHVLTAPFAIATLFTLPHVTDSMNYVEMSDSRTKDIIHSDLYEVVAITSWLLTPSYSLVKEQHEFNRDVDVVFNEHYYKPIIILIPR